MVLAKKYAGDEVKATATGHAITTRGDLGASYVAQERIVGTVLGRTGSFVLEARCVHGRGHRDRAVGAGGGRQRYGRTSPG